MRTIFLSIAAYRDPQLGPTIADCLARARHPERLRFGICWQHGDDEAPLPWAGDERFRILDVPWQASRGACWARAEVMALYAGEDYFLQLDSHHRFVDGWDELVIAELHLAPSDRPVLTAYATPFNPDELEAREDLPMQMNFDRFTDEAIILFRPGELRDWRTRTRPARARFLSAHFLFTLGRFVHDVPYDPELYFTGEEITLAVRAYTHGYDFFHPRQVIVWHEYTRDYRPHKHWTDHDDTTAVELAWHTRDQSSLAKVAAFLADPQPGPFGLGTARTFADYEAFAGVNFARQRAQEYTRHGFEPPNPRAEAGWADHIRAYALDLAIEKARLPDDVTDYQFWYVGVHDEHGHEILRRDVDRAEVAALLAGPAPHVVIHCAFETGRVPARWTVWPVSDSRGWLERIDGPVLPLHPPVTLVTALIDLGRDRLAPSFQRSFTTHYLPLFERLLATPLPMVVHVEPALEHVVWRHRHPSNTAIVLTRREDLERGEPYAPIQRIRASDEWRGQAGWLADSPQAALAHYNALVFSKMAWLADAARTNPFGASHLFWIDAGLLNTVPAPFLEAPALAQRLVTAADAFLWVEYPYPDGREIHGFPRAELAALAGVTDVDRVARGGFFGGPVGQVGAVAQRYADLQRSTLEHGLMGTEESLFTILAYREPERYAHYLIERNGLLAPFFEAVVAGTAHERRSAPAVRPVALVPQAPQPAGPDDIEVPADVERGLTSFFGLPLMQNRRAILALDRVLHHLDASGQRVARIIELGTGTGGLSVLFRIFTLTSGAAFTTYDRWDCTSPAGRLFERLGVDARRDDIGADFTAAAITRDIQRPGVTLLVCDGADKVADVTRFVPFLKTGDVVMAHDYAASTAEFGERLRGRAWNWCEITDGDLTAVTAAHALEPVCPELLGPAAWMCRVKRGPHVVAAPRVQAESGRLAVYLLTYNAPAQLALWFETAARVEPQLVAGGAPRILLDNSTAEGAARQNAALAQRFGFTYTRAGNLGIVGGRVWCARHFAEHDEADVMIFFEDDMLLHESPGLCRNGLPTSVPGLLTAAVAILQNEVSLDFLKLSYTEFYGDHRKNWAYYNVAPAERAAMFPDGPDTRIAAIKSHRGVSYALGEVHYSNWPLLITRRGNERLFLQASEAAQFEQTLMVRALELARAGELEGAVLLASPINHDRQVHYEGGRKES